MPYVPAGHIVRLAQRVEFEGYVHGAVDAEQAKQAVVHNEAVGVVVAQQDVMLVVKATSSSKDRDAVAPVGIWG